MGAAAIDAMRALRVHAHAGRPVIGRKTCSANDLCQTGSFWHARCSWKVRAANCYAAGELLVQWPGPRRHQTSGQGDERDEAGAHIGGGR